LGERGQSQIIPLTAGELAESRIAQEAKKYHGEGYRRLKEGEPVTVLVQYEFDGWGTPADLDKRHEMEGTLNECLGWTGNGHCDGGDIGSGTINVCLLVVNPYLAARTIVEELRRTNLIEGAVIAIEHESSFEVLYPTDYQKEFAYWYE